MRFLYTFVIAANIVILPLNAKAEYIDMSGFEALQNKLSNEENTNKSKHYDIFEKVSNSLMLRSTSTFGRNNIKRSLERQLDDYNHYARKVKIACQNSHPKISYVKQHFRLASEVVDDYLTKYGY